MGSRGIPLAYQRDGYELVDAIDGRSLEATLEMAWTSQVFKSCGSGGIANGSV